MKQEKEFKEFLDTDVNLKDDFYHYADGGWQKKNPLKGEFSSYGVFNAINEESRKRVRTLIENLGKTPEARVKNTIEQKINDIYLLGMDMDRRNREGVEPIRHLLNDVDNLTDENLADYIIKIRKERNSGMISIGVGADPADSSMNIVHVDETGLMLRDRDYYLEKNETNEKILNAYHNYVLRIMELAGYDKGYAEKVWQDVIEIETQIAEHVLTREESRDPMLYYNWMTLEQLEVRYPNIDWKANFDALNFKDLKGVNVASVKYLDFFNNWWPTVTAEKFKSYRTVSILSSATTSLSDDMFDADFEFNSVIYGVLEKRPLWKRVTGIVNSMFGEAVGEIYVKKYFPTENKEYMLRLVENLRTSLGGHISALEWMSDVTKKKALDKLKAMKVKIGYPNKWKDYSGLEVDPSLSYNENLRRASRWYVFDNLSKAGKPVDKEEWFMYPQTVNAYYSPVNNEICFPAGILQSPFFDINADDEVNYGAIGVIIGHEMTHGFDDQGRQFDKNGNLANWWTDEDVKKFNALTDKLMEQFNAIEVAPGVKANGKYTLGENIADQGGLRIALSALLNAKKDDKDFDPNKADESGFTPLQKFYLAYAHAWANNIRPEEILERTKTDPHSLALNRVNVTLKNITPFMDAFGIKEGDGMFRPESERVVIW